MLDKIKIFWFRITITLAMLWANLCKKIAGAAQALYVKNKWTLSKLLGGFNGFITTSLGRGIYFFGQMKYQLVFFVCRGRAAFFFGFQQLFGALHSIRWLSFNLMAQLQKRLVLLAYGGLNQLLASLKFMRMLAGQPIKAMVYLAGLIVGWWCNLGQFILRLGYVFKHSLLGVLDKLKDGVKWFCATLIYLFGTFKISVQKLGFGLVKAVWRLLVGCLQQGLTLILVFNAGVQGQALAVIEGFKQAGFLFAHLGFSLLQAIFYSIYNVVLGLGWVLQVVLTFIYGCFAFSRAKIFGSVGAAGSVAAEVGKNTQVALAKAGGEIKQQASRTVSEFIFNALARVQHLIFLVVAFGKRNIYGALQAILGLVWYCRIGLGRLKFHLRFNILHMLALTIYSLKHGFANLILVIRLMFTKAYGSIVYLGELIYRKIYNTWYRLHSGFSSGSKRVVYGATHLGRKSWIGLHYYGHNTIYLLRNHAMRVACAFGNLGALLRQVPSWVRQALATLSKVDWWLVGFCLFWTAVAIGFPYWWMRHTASLTRPTIGHFKVLNEAIRLDCPFASQVAVELQLLQMERLWSVERQEWLWHGQAMLQFQLPPGTESMEVLESFEFYQAQITSRQLISLVPDPYKLTLRFLVHFNQVDRSDWRFFPVQQPWQGIILANPEAYPQELLFTSVKGSNADACSMQILNIVPGVWSANQELELVVASGAWPAIFFSWSRPIHNGVATLFWLLWLLAVGYLLLNRILAMRKATLLVPSNPTKFLNLLPLLGLAGCATLLFLGLSLTAGGIAGHNNLLVRFALGLAFWFAGHYCYNLYAKQHRFAPLQASIGLIALFYLGFLIVF